MEILTIILLSCVCLYLLFTLVKFLHKVWWTPIRLQKMMRAQGIKGPPYRFLRGNTKEISSMIRESMGKRMDISHHIIPRVQPHIYSWVKLYGTNFINWPGPRAQVVVTEPELIKEILSNRDGAFPRAEAEVFLNRLLGERVATTEGENWVKLRKLSNHAFHGESLKSMIPAMIASTEMMLERWKLHEGKEIDAFQELRLLTSEVISRRAFGSSYLEGEKIFDMLLKLCFISSRSASRIRLQGISKIFKTKDDIESENLVKGISDCLIEMTKKREEKVMTGEIDSFGNDFRVRLPGVSKIFKSKDDIESENLVKGIHDCIIGMIKKREEKVMTGEVDSFGSDFLGVLVKADHDADKSKRISVEDMIDECKTFYIAGQETTNTLLAWTVLLLAIHTDWQEEARKEVLKLFGQQIPNLDDIERLKTMNMIIHESLRLYPPVVALTRNVKREVKVGKLIFPANLKLHMPTLALHHDSTIWGEDVHLFKPERFSEGVAKATNNNMAAFFPFGLGPRSCVGFNFATFEAKIALSKILQRYTFTLSPAYVHFPFQLLTIRPQYGVQIMIHPV